MNKNLIHHFMKYFGIEIKRSDKALEQYLTLYERYHQLTMIPKESFGLNLQLCNAFRHVAGDYVECGVWRGGMSAAIAEVLGVDRRIHLFDSFEGLPPAREIDGKEALVWQNDTTSAGYFDNCTADEKFAIEAMNLAGHKNYEIYKGWFEKTLEGNSLGPIAILRLDGDWYDSIMICLDHLFPKVSDGGIVLLDDYYTWDGCAKAVHDYLSKIKSPSRIHQWNNQVAFIIKKN